MKTTVWMAGTARGIGDGRNTERQIEVDGRDAERQIEDNTAGTLRGRLQTTVLTAGTPRGRLKTTVWTAGTPRYRLKETTLWTARTMNGRVSAIPT